eukprot:817093_1
MAQSLDDDGSVYSIKDSTSSTASSQQMKEKPLKPSPQPPRSNSTAWCDLENRTKNADTTWLLQFVNIGNDKCIALYRTGMFGTISLNGFMYNNSQQEWTHIINMDLQAETYMLCVQTVAFNPSDQALYILTNESLIIWNLHSKDVSVVKQNIVNFGMGAKSLFVKDTFHIIGGSRNNAHYTWDTNTRTFHRIHAFDHLWGGSPRIEWHGWVFWP